MTSSSLPYHVIWPRGPCHILINQPVTSPKSDWKSYPPPSSASDYLSSFSSYSLSTNHSNSCSNNNSNKMRSTSFGEKIRRDQIENNGWSSERKRLPSRGRLLKEIVINEGDCPRFIESSTQQMWGNYLTHSKVDRRPPPSTLPPCARLMLMTTTGMATTS
jgi:hypothetical protein